MCHCQTRPVQSYRSLRQEQLPKAVHMTPTFTYEQAVLLSHITPSKLLPYELCTNYSCLNCPTCQPQAFENVENCVFSLAYAGGYSEAYLYTRRDMRLQLPPEQYPELYV